MKKLLILLLAIELLAFFPLTGCTDYQRTESSSPDYQSGWEISQTQTNTLLGIWGSSADDIFAVGNDGIILHYAGNN